MFVLGLRDKEEEKQRFLAASGKVGTSPKSNLQRSRLECKDDTRRVSC